MKRALIATLYNEADNVAQWWDCLRRQTEMPDEIAIVDGGSRDGTWEKLQELARTSPIPVRLEQHRCNIAGGRNRAIRLTMGEIIAVTDAGSFPEPAWFAEITKPLLLEPGIDCTGGLNIANNRNEFQKFLEIFEPRQETGRSGGQVHPSSRNTAFRREAWAAVGGYPEWLTLAGEDSLFTHELVSVGKKTSYIPGAVVHWSVRPNMPAYYKLLHRNGYGAAEARLYTPYFLRRGLITLCPFLLLLSRHRFRHLEFRYRKNASSVLGWLAGLLKGHRPPPGWKRVDGILLSPESQNYLAGKHHLSGK
jgi:cellulose synthase/poly-beta-1,6-N-acetylglucosamine synthase-like glycosyltransferase